MGIMAVRVFGSDNAFSITFVLSGLYLYRAFFRPVNTVGFRYEKVFMHTPYGRPGGFDRKQTQPENIFLPPEGSQGSVIDAEYRRLD